MLLLRTILVLLFCALAATAWAEDGPMDTAATSHQRLDDLLAANGSPADVIAARSDLALADIDLGKLREAEFLVRQNLDAATQAFGAERPEFASVVLVQALLELNWGHDAEAEKLNRHALDLFRAALAPDAPQIRAASQALASVLAEKGNFDEAAALLQSVSVSSEAAPEELLSNFDAQATLRMGRDDYAGAHTLLMSSLAIAEKLYGPQSYHAALRKTAVAAMLFAQGTDYEESRALLEDALATSAEFLGPDHPALASPLTSLAAVDIGLGDFDGAMVHARRATGIVEKWAAVLGGGDTSALDLDGNTRLAYALQIYAAWRLSQDDPARQEEMMNAAFEAFQSAQNPKAAQALLRMAMRFAENDPEFAKLMRRYQDLSAAVRKSSDAHIADATKLNSPDHVFAGISTTQIDLAKVKWQIDHRFTRSGSQPGGGALDLAETQALLHDDEILVAVWQGLDAPGTGLVIAITREDIWWTAIDGTGIAQQVEALRASLGVGGPSRGVSAVADEAVDSDTLDVGFDFAPAAAIYRTIFAPIEQLLDTKRHLIVVPSAELAGLPFQTLVRAVPEDSALRTAKWLIRDHAISVLPSIASLKALRASTAPSAAGRSFGFGDPQLGALSQTLQPLPDTAGELARLGESLSSSSTDIHLGLTATEATVRSEPLDQYKILAFATHGLKPGDLPGLAESSLVLTPSGEDDGLLTESEIATLKLDADWVILSACNTAGGGGAGGEGLSGLARAFFYAGARSLLVSHWPVYSDAAVKLTTGTLGELAAHPEIGRAEALQRAMLAIIDNDPDPSHWQPRYWAPFALVGEGGGPALR